LVRFGDFLSLFSWDFSFQNGDGFVVDTHQVPDFDASLGSDSNPLHFWVEGNTVDGRAGVEGSGWLGEIQNVPDEEFLVSSSGGDVFSVW